MRRAKNSEGQMKDSEILWRAVALKCVPGAGKGMILKDSGEGLLAGVTVSVCSIVSCGWSRDDFRNIMASVF